MIIFDDCIRCGSKNIDKLMVNSRLALNYPEQKELGVSFQRVVNPTDAIICKDCGHIELFIDITKLNRPL